MCDVGANGERGEGERGEGRASGVDRGKARCDGLVVGMRTSALIQLFPREELKSRR